MVSTHIYETLNEDYNDKYEYIFPDITLIKILLVMKKLVAWISNELQSKKYDTINSQIS